jgi:hypothetical protein
MNGMGMNRRTAMLAASTAICLMVNMPAYSQDTGSLIQFVSGSDVSPAQALSYYRSLTSKGALNGQPISARKDASV